MRLAATEGNGGFELPSALSVPVPDRQPDPAQQEERLPAEYVLPLRSDSEDDPDLTEYLAWLSGLVQVTVVDGSDQAQFDAHAAAWGRYVRQLRPQPWPGRNGKVAGVVTGVHAARAELVVLADDDVRYTEQALRELLSRLGEDSTDVVRPQNVFVPLPWHARWDTARSLLNRAFGADYPGTFGVRRSTFLAVGGYCGDVMFENLQMLRTFAAGGAREVLAPDIYVPRRPPTTGKFLDQRVRQAYDDLAQPGRLLLELSWLPLLILLAARRASLLVLGAGAAVVIAEAGRRKHRGTDVYPPTAALWAPAWVAERALCVWLALVERARGGVRYRGERLRHAAVPVAARPLAGGRDTAFGRVE